MKGFGPPNDHELNMKVTWNDVLTLWSSRKQILGICEEPSNFSRNCKWVPKGFKQRSKALKASESYSNTILTLKLR